MTAEMTQQALIERPELETVRVKLTEVDASEYRGPDPSPAFVREIKEQGVIEPLILERKPKKLRSLRNQKPYRLMHGSRRLKAAWRCYTETQDDFYLDVPAEVYDVGELDGKRLAARMNNLRAANPHEDVRAIVALKAKGLSDKEIRAELGLKPGTYRNRVLVTEMIDPLIDHFMSNRIPPTLASKAAKLTPGQQQRAALIIDQKGKLTEKDLKALKAVSVEEVRAEQGDIFSIGADLKPLDLTPEQRIERALGAIGTMGTVSQDGSYRVNVDGQWVTVRVEGE